MGFSCLAFFPTRPYCSSTTTTTTTTATFIHNIQVEEEEKKKTYCSFAFVTTQHSSKPGHLSEKTCCNASGLYLHVVIIISTCTSSLNLIIIYASVYWKIHCPLVKFIQNHIQDLSGILYFPYPHK